MDSEPLASPMPKQDLSPQLSDYHPQENGAVLITGNAALWCLLHRFSDRGEVLA